MEVFINKKKRQIQIQVRAEEDGVIANISRIIGPGEKFFEWPYEQLAKLPNGKNILEEKKTK